VTTPLTPNPFDAENNVPAADYRQHFALNFKDKHVNYDEKISTLLLRALGRGFDVGRYKKEKTLSLSRVCADLFEGCIGLGAKKITDPVNLQLLISCKLHTTALWREFAEVKSNWSFANTVGVIFDHHGDGVTDLVLHADPRMLDEQAWHMVTFHRDGTRYYIQPLTGFMGQLKVRYAP